MARIRSIKPEFWEDDKIGALDPLARLLFIACWNVADDEGLLRWTAVYLKSVAFIYDKRVKVKQVEDFMRALEEAGLVFPYAGGKTQQPLGYIVNFRKHQRINRPQPGKLPPPCIQNRRICEMYARRDGWVCGICHEPIPTDYMDEGLSLSLDHIEPRVKGGSDYPSNIRATHLSCNKARGPGREAGMGPMARISLTGSLFPSVNGSVADKEGKGKVVGMDQGTEEEGMRARASAGESKVDWDVEGTITDIILQANRGMMENKNLAYAEPIPPVHGPSRQVVSEWLSEIPADAIKGVVYERARSYQPVGRHKQIHSLKYFDSAVRSEWDRVQSGKLPGITPKELEAHRSATAATEALLADAHENVETVRDQRERVKAWTKGHPDEAEELWQECRTEGMEKGLESLGKRQFDSFVEARFRVRVIAEQLA